MPKVAIKFFKRNGACRLTEKKPVLGEQYTFRYVGGAYGQEPDTMLFFVSRGFFFFCQRVVPNVFAQTQLPRKRLRLTDSNLTSTVQKFLNKRVVSRLFGNMFHKEYLD